MTGESEEIQRAIEEARTKGDDDAVSQLESYFGQLSGPALSREHRLDKIENLQGQLEDQTVAKDRNDVGSYWGGLGRLAQPSEERPPLEQIQSVEDMGREVPQPLLDPYSRTGQTLTAFDTGIKRQLGDYFKKKDDAVRLRDNLYEHVYNELSPVEQKRMEAPRHWGWKYDSYKNMPFLDFKGALDKGGEWTEDNWKQLLGEDLYTDMLKGEDPMAEEAGGFYRFFVQPWLSEGNMKPSERLYQTVENARKNWYTDETRESLEKPFVAKDAQWYKPWSWFDETTKAPWEDWDGFYYSVAENTPQITAGILSARGGGRLGSRLAALEKLDKAEDVIDLQRKMSMAGGMLAGAGSEAIMIRDNVYAETSKRVEQLPDEKWEQNPEYQQLVGSGASPELAKQVVGTEVGLKAANTAGVVAGLFMGSPMSAFFGHRAAGEIGGSGSSFFANMMKGTAGEGAQEGSQEAMEQFIGNLNVSYLDPEQRLLEGVGEAAAGGALIGMGPGAVGSMAGSGDQQAAGFSDEQVKALQASMDVRKAMADRYAFEKEITGEEASNKSPRERLNDYHKLERMQRKEAETILENEEAMRNHMQSAGGSETEMKMLTRLVAKANMTLADIDAAEARRTTAAQQLMEEQEIHKERARIEKAVSENLMKLDDIQRQLSTIEAVQNFEAVPEELTDELVKEGYGRWVGQNQEKFIILPKGKRAQKEMVRQAANLTKQIDEGYAGPERRRRDNDLRRQMIDSANEEQREALLYKDALTGIENRRAFNERAQDAPVVAAVDVDSLKWVNDNMGQHASGDRLLMNVAEALNEQEGVNVYRFDGDEFAVTGETNEQVEAALQSAVKALQDKPIRNDRDEIIPSITWGKGKTYDEADVEAAKMKRQRAQSGKRAGRDKPPPSLRNRDQGTLFHREEPVYANVVPDTVSGSGSYSFTVPAQKGGIKPLKGELMHSGKGWRYKTDEMDSWSKKRYQSRQKAAQAAWAEFRKPTTRFQSGTSNEILKEIRKAQTELNNSRRMLDSMRNLDGEVEAGMSDLYRDTVAKRDEAEQRIDSLEAQLNSDQAADLPTHWRQVSDIVQSGDDIEILTPDGAVVGVITSIKPNRKRPRLTVNLQGREFTFNPTRNWLIVNDMTDPADLAWLTGDPEYAQPDRETFPQVLSDITIGHIGSDGNWIADLSSDSFAFSSDPSQESWWANEYPEWSDNIPWIPRTLKAFDEATPKTMGIARGIVERKLAGFTGLPPINLVDSMETLEKVAPETVAEARTMGMSFNSIHGFFDENRPENGIVIIVPNIPGKPGEERFENNITETLLHELIGHYGVRGVFGQTNQDLRQFMHEVVDQFPELAKIIGAQVPRRSMTEEHHKEMVGEEMIAYVTGEMLAGTFEPNAKQKNFLQRFFDWVRSWLVKAGLIKPDPVSSRQKFWNDDRIRDLVARSTDFVRSGKVVNKPFKPFGSNTRFMRDRDIFKSGMAIAIQNATRTLSGSQRKQLASKYGGKQNVPKEIPMFDEAASPNKYMDTIRKLKSDNKISKKELELTKLDPDGDWNFLRDSTYADIRGLLPEGEQGVESGWWNQIMPPHLADEMTKAVKATRVKAVTPVTTGQGGRAPVGLGENATNKKVAAEKRIYEILQSKIDPKRTQLTKDILLNYLDESNKVVRLYVDDVEGLPEVTYQHAAMTLFGDKALEDGFVENLTEEEQEMIKQEIHLSTTRGFDIGFSERRQEWLDRTSRGVRYSEYSPKGSGVGRGDYRITYLIQEGGGLRRGKHGHFDGREGVITHIRTGLAVMGEVEGGPAIPKAPNPKMQGRALTMIELQSDWLQQLRKGFTSASEERETQETANEARRMLRTVSEMFGGNTIAALQLQLKELVKPVANLPEGTMRQVFESRINESYPDGATQDQKDIVYQSIRNDLLTEVIMKIDAAAEQAFAYANEYKESHDIRHLATAVDARAFERLDKLTASAIASQMGDSLKALSGKLDTVRNTDFSREEFVPLLQSYVNKSMSRFGNLMRDQHTNYTLRLPLATGEIRKFMVPAFEKLGLNEGVVDDILAETKEVRTASFRLPVIPMGTIMKESGQIDRETQEVTITNEILSSERLQEHGIVPSSITIRVEKAPSDEQEITVSGRSDSIEKFREMLPLMVKKWAEEDALNIWREEYQRKADLDAALDGLTESEFTHYPWDEMESAFGITEIDVDSEQTEELTAYGVTGYYSWEEENLDEYRDNIIRERISEIDWSEVTNDHGESLSRDGDGYRERLEIDEDGDVDNEEAEQWIRNERDDYERSLYEDNEVNDAASEEARDRFNEDPPMLWIGHVPVEWDEDGDELDSVEIAVLQDVEGGFAEIRINGEQVLQGFSTKPDAFDSVSKAIQQYYESEEIEPPAGEMFSKVIARAEPASEQSGQNEEEVSPPNFADMADAITSGTYELTTRPQRSDQVFNAMVTANTKLNRGSGIYPDSPFAPDKFWRTAALKYLIADAVRRGIPSIVWHPGSASTSRGGWGPDWSTEDRLLWGVEEIDIRGESQEMLVIRRGTRPNQPIVLTWDRAIRTIGSDAVSHIQKQLRGELPAKPSDEDVTQNREPSKDDYLLSRSSNWVSVHHRYSGEFVSVFESEGAASRWIEEDIQNRKNEDTGLDNEIQEGATGVGRVISGGEVTRQSLGGRINVSLPAAPATYEHTFSGGPRSSAARNSYEIITKNIWEKELQKYGGEIKEHWIKTEDMRASEEHEGMVVKPTKEREERIKEDHGRIEIKELTGDTYGWIIVSEKGGILKNRVYTSKAEAQIYLDDLIREQYGNRDGAVKVFYIEVNDKMREEFSGPVTPFHYDPTKDPRLKEAAEKIGYEATKFRERLAGWRQLWKDHFNQGMFDRFYGIKRATNRAGLILPAESDPYIQTRLTTSLDSVMKSVMEYGHPIWKEGIVQTEGRGLLDILQPVMEDADLWGMYMAGVRAKRLFTEGRENLFTEEEITAMVELGEEFPVFKRVAADYADFNKKVLDFAEASGVINKETRPLWESADYVPFYRVQDERLTGPLSGGAGVANQKAPIRRLKGGEANIGNITHNILVNLTKLVDSSMKNHAALLAVDSLREAGIISKKPMTHSQELIPLAQVKKLLIDRGMNPDAIPEDALKGMQKMFAIQPPEGEGVISILRDGKKEFYFTDDILLYRAMTAINKKAWGQWMTLMRAPKRLLTTMITLDPGFMIANYMRDSLSAFVLSRDQVIPILSGIRGFQDALMKNEDMRTLMSAGAAFESGYINQYDPKATNRLIKRAMRKKSFRRTLLTSPAKLFEAWKALGSAAENANRLAVYQAAIRAGKGKARAAYEAKDLMDFSMGGDWPFIQFLIQTVPFMGARLQGLHRLGRGAMEHPVGFTIKGTLVGLAGLALWFAFRDDDRYKELEEWDKDTYFHFWVGENHYRLPKPFEVGALFNTVPERIFEYMYSRENDAGKLLMKRFGFMMAETFNMNPVPQTFRPMLESYFNYNWFTGRSIVSPYEEQRMPPEQYRYTTSPTMVELARLLPGGLDTASGKIRSPLHLQNLYAGYTGTLGRYFLMGSDAFLRQQLDHPLPPERDISRYPVLGRFLRGDSPQRTKYEEEVYRLIDKTVAIQGSLSFLERAQLDDRMNEILEEHEPYIRVSGSLESIREDVRDVNRSIMNLWMDPEMPPEQKKEEIDLLQEQKNILFREGYELRPGGKSNPERPFTQMEVIDLIDKFGVDDSTAYLKYLQEESPGTYELLDIIRNNMEKRNILSLAKARAGDQ